MILPEDLIRMLRTQGALLEDDHFVYAGGGHGSAYIVKDALYPNIRLMDLLYRNMIMPVVNAGIETVIGPAIGGIILANNCARHLMQYAGNGEVSAVYAEKKQGGFLIGRGYDKYVTRRRVLVVEDVLNSGQTVRQVVEAVKACGGIPLAVTAIVNRGDAGAADLGVDRLHALLDYKLEAWPAHICPLCEKGMPVNTTYGHGVEFLKR